MTLHEQTDYNNALAEHKLATTDETGNCYLHKNCVTHRVEGNLAYSEI
jgi:hypothetical protein